MVKPGSIPGVVFVRLVHRIHLDVGNRVLFLVLKYFEKDTLLFNMLNNNK